MATQQTVWFAEGTDRYFDTQAKAVAYEEQQALMLVIEGAGINAEASKKVAKAIQAKYTLTVKP